MIINDFFKDGIQYSTLKLTERAKNTDEKVLIFLPGIGAYKENYFKYLEGLLHFYNTIYCLDLPSQGSIGDWSIDNFLNMISKIIAIVDTDDVQHIDLSGHSAGAIAVSVNVNKVVA